MKFVFGIFVALCLGAVYVCAAPKSSPTDLLSNPAALAYIAEKLQQNPTALLSLLTFLTQNGITIEQIAAGNINFSDDLVNKFTAFLQTDPSLRAFVLEILNHFGIQIPRIDWGAIGSALLGAVNVAVENLPTIISIVSLFGKRDLSLQSVLSSGTLTTLIQLAGQLGISLTTVLQAINAVQTGNLQALLGLVSGLNFSQILANLDIQSLLSQFLPLIQNLIGGVQRDALPQAVILAMIAGFEALIVATSPLAQKIRDFLAANGVSAQLLLSSLQNGTYGQYLTASTIQKVRDFLEANPDVAAYFYQNFGDLIPLIPIPSF